MCGRTAFAPRCSGFTIRQIGGIITPYRQPRPQGDAFAERPSRLYTSAWGASQSSPAMRIFCLWSRATQNLSATSRRMRELIHHRLWGPRRLSSKACLPLMKSSALPRPNASGGSSCWLRRELIIRGGSLNTARCPPDASVRKSSQVGAEKLGVCATRRDLNVWKTTAPLSVLSEPRI